MAIHVKPSVFWHCLAHIFIQKIYINICFEPDMEKSLSKQRTPLCLWHKHDFWNKKKIFFDTKMFLA